MYTLLVLLLAATAVLAVNSDAHTCLDAKHHKTQPGPEDSLHSQCSPWQNRSCCTHETTKALHDDTLSYRFNYNHCADVQPMSAKCRRHFTQDHCFYECSPNVGPWVVEEGGRSWRKERFFGAPLCHSDCQTWYDSCRDDYTCTDNWARKFDWKTVEAGPTADRLGMSCRQDESHCRVNVCPSHSKCRKVSEVFGSADNFCSKVWDGSWAPANDSKPCLRLWFDGSAGNPNDAVAELYYASGTSASTTSGLLVLGALLVLW